MAKRTQRQHLRNVKDQVGCMWGLISMFDFRHGRYTKKLLSDRKWRRQFKGQEYSQNELMPSHSLKCQDSEGDEERSASIDNGERSVKKLMEEDMLGPQKTMNACNKTSELVDDNDTYDLDRSKSLMLEECDDTKKLENYDPQFVSQELRQILEKSGVLHLKNIYDKHSDQTLNIDKERLTTFIKVLIDQNLHFNQFRDEGQFRKSSVFMEALQKFGSQRDLFLQLLQDPNFLMVNQIEGLEEAIVDTDPSFIALTEKSIQSKTDEVINDKPRKFFRKRSKSQESFLTPGNEKCQSSGKIVILKPGSALQEPDPSVSKMHHFSFSEIKRKLKHAMKKERQVISTNGFDKQDQKQGINGENIEWCFSPNRNHFFNERYITPCIGMKKKKETFSKSNKTESLRALSDTQESRVSDIYVKAKKNILEMIEDGDNDARKVTRELPKPLGTVISLPEYDFSSIDIDFGSISDQERPSYSNDAQIVNKSSDRIAEEDIECQPSKSSSCLNCDTCSEDMDKADESIPGDHDRDNTEIREINDHLCQEDNVIAEADYAAEECVQLSVDSEILSSTSASPSNSCVPSKVENHEGFTDRPERPSPVSVLDQCLSEDDVSPARTISWPVDMNIQPREIVFSDERPCNDLRISSEDNETAFEYVEAVLLGSGLNWDEYLLRWLSSDNTVLDSSLYDEVELFSSKPQHEQQMLFDCTNEVLEEVCDRYFGSFCSSRCNYLAVPKGMDLILEIWEGVKWYLHRYPQSQSLDQLIKTDMARSRAWMDLRLDSEHIVLEIEKDIFENLVEDVVLSSISGVSEGDFGSFRA